MTPSQAGGPAPSSESNRRRAVTTSSGNSQNGSIATQPVSGPEMGDVRDNRDVAQFGSSRRDSLDRLVAQKGRGLYAADPAKDESPQGGPRAAVFIRALVRAARSEPPAAR